MILACDSCGTSHLEHELDDWKTELADRLVRREPPWRIRQVEHEIRAVWAAIEREFDGLAGRESR